MPRHASELENSPLFLQRKQHDAPVSVGMDMLAVEEGNRLEQMTVIDNSKLVNAMMILGIYSNIYGSKYAQWRKGQIERIAEAKGGQRAQDIIKVIEAGGKLPAEYYTGQSKNTFSPIDGVNE